MQYNNYLKSIIVNTFWKVLKMDLSRLLWVWLNYVLWMDFVSSSNIHPRIKSNLRHDFYTIFGKSLSLNAKYLIKKQVKSECKPNIFT